MFDQDGTEGVYKEVREFKFIRKMAVEGATSKIRVEIDTLVFYRKSKIGIIGAKLMVPIMSQGKLIAVEGEQCNIKFRLDLLNFARIENVKFLELIIRNSYEEKFFKGNLIKQFVAESFSDYISDERKTVNF